MADVSVFESIESDQNIPNAERQYVVKCYSDVNFKILSVTSFNFFIRFPSLRIVAAVRTISCDPRI